MCLGAVGHTLALVHRDLAVAVQHVQRGDEELVRVLLFVPGQVTGVVPDQMQESVQRKGATVAVVELLEQFGHLADQTSLRCFNATLVAFGQKVVPEEWRVDERLHNAVHKASGAQV